MNKIFYRVSTAVLVVGLVASIARAQPAEGDWAGGYGPGMMWGGGGYGPDYGPGWTCLGWSRGRYGPAMMWGGGYGPGYGSGGWGQRRNLDLSVPQVERRMQQWVKASGNPNIKVGLVTKKNDDTITAQIVTTDKGDLVQEYHINRQTGAIEPVEK